MRGVESVVPSGPTIRGLSGINNNQIGFGSSFKPLFTRGVRPGLGFLTRESVNAGTVTPDQVSNPNMDIQTIVGGVTRGNRKRPMKRKGSKRLRDRGVRRVGTRRQPKRSKSKKRRSNEKGINRKRRAKTLTDIFH